MKKTTNPNIDPAYLSHCRETTPEARMDWLGQAFEFVQMVKASRSKKGMKTIKF